MGRSRDPDRHQPVATLGPVIDWQGSHVTRPFLAGVVSFTVRCDSRETRDVMEALFADLVEPPPDARHREFDLRDVDHDGVRLLQLSGFGDFESVVALPPDAALDILVSRVNRLSLDEDPDRLHLHAAAVAAGEHGVLVSAPGGTGKTTLVTALVQRGWDYLTDEAVALGAGEPSITGFAKPLTIKQTGQDLFAELEGRRVAFGPSTDTSWHVPASRIGGRPIVRAVPTLIVFLERDADGSAPNEPNWAPVHPADAVVALMQESMDVTRFGERALIVVAELASRGASVQIYVGAPRETAQLVEQIVEQILADRSRLSCPLPKLVSRGDRSEYATELRVSDRIISVVLDGRVVTHDVRTGKLVSFDESGSAVWLALHGCASEECPPPDTPGVRTFLQELEREGLVTGCTGA